MKETLIIPYCNPKICLLPGLCPGPRWGTYDAPLDPLVDWGGRPSPDTSHSAPSAPRLPRSGFGAYIINLRTQPPPPLYLS